MKPHIRLHVRYLYPDCGQGIWQTVVTLPNGKESRFNAWWRTSHTALQSARDTINAYDRVNRRFYP